MTTTPNAPAQAIPIWILSVALTAGVGAWFANAQSGAERAVAMQDKISAIHQAVLLQGESDKATVKSLDDAWARIRHLEQVMASLDNEINDARIELELLKTKAGGSNG